MREYIANFNVHMRVRVLCFGDRGSGLNVVESRRIVCPVGWGSPDVM